MGYVGRFAPSPTGALHAGSVVAALASWLDARAHGGRWLVRIEDLDAPRCVPGADATILSQLAALGLHGDAPPTRQSTRKARYEAAADVLLASGWAYPCGCTRAQIEAAIAAGGGTHERHGETVYPGTCRDGLHGRAARALRLLVAPALTSPPTPLRLAWTDRRLGPQRQDVSAAVGDFVLERADGIWAYQLAVVVDDAEQGVTHVVRGADLADNTPRQIHLQRVLGAPTPSYLHAPLVRGSDGQKLSKQNGALAVSTGEPLRVLHDAGAVLGLASSASTPQAWLAAATAQWHRAWVRD